MDHHKILYKDARSQTPRQFIRQNRELQVANRCKQRRDRFQDSRNISPSPTPHRKEIIIPLCQPTEDKENDGNQEHQKSIRLAKIVCDSNPEKLSKQEAYLKRFVKYKDAKKELKKPQKELNNKKKPFISAVSSGRQMSAASSTESNIVPKGHPKGFQPPQGLKNPLEEKKVSTCI